MFCVSQTVLDLQIVSLLRGCGGALLEVSNFFSGNELNCRLLNKALVRYSDHSC